MEICFGKRSNCHLLPTSKTKLVDFRLQAFNYSNSFTNFLCILNRTGIHQISPMYCFRLSVELEFQPKRKIEMSQVLKVSRQFSRDGFKTSLKARFKYHFSFRKSKTKSSSTLHVSNSLQDLTRPWK